MYELRMKCRRHGEYVSLVKVDGVDHYWCPGPRGFPDGYDHKYPAVVMPDWLISALAESYSR